MIMDQRCHGYVAQMLAAVTVYLNMLQAYTVLLMFPFTPKHSLRRVCLSTGHTMLLRH